MSEEELIDKYKGCLFGLAIGDALGAQVEFLERDTFTVTDMPDKEDEGEEGILPGFFTDDTSMALCLADSLIQCEGFKPIDQMYRYLKWLSAGYMSPFGFSFGIGNATLKALNKFTETKDPMAGSDNPMTAGNGSLMRLAPIPMMYRTLPEELDEYARLSSQTTHGAKEAVDACCWYAGLIVGALNGENKADLLSAKRPRQTDIAPAIEAIAKGSYQHKNRNDITSDGYVVHTLEAALWCFHTSTTFEEGALLAVNLGGDSDTTAAVYGQLAGAFYGFQAIPKNWRDIICMQDTLEDFSLQLYHLSNEIPSLDSEN